ncbi:MAG: GGDEF domain-containing protein, partial [Leptothrix sp. (in: b-proteobacteria)]
EHFDEHLRREVALSQREEREFALVLIAVDQAEALQRQHGEGALARVIESVGHLMRANTRAMDVLAQLGQDRFAILFSGIGLATAHNRVEQLRRACATELVVQAGVPLHFEISAGVATFPHSADSLATLSAAAQRALGDAQSRGGNRVALASIALRPPQVG